jgi:hypothetical protein
MEKIMNENKLGCLGLILLALFAYFIHNWQEDKLQDKYTEGYDDATDEVIYRSASFSAGYDSGYTDCSNGIMRQY